MRLFVILSAAGAVAAFAVAGCGAGGYSTGGSRSTGKQLFTERCGSCHKLVEAGTAGKIGPDLDHAFAQARADGLTNDTFTQVVREQVLHPITKTSTGAPGMPDPDQTLPLCADVEGDAFCVDDQKQAANDIAVYVASVAGTGAAPQPGGGGEADGKAIFTGSAGCSGCHTLADAGATGTIGPNLDQAKPPKALVVQRVTNGKGQMPSFKDTLDPGQIKAVAEYVSSAAGG